MSKKHSLLLFSLFSAVAGGSVAAASFLYNLTVTPHDMTEERSKDNPLDAESIKWLRSHEQREDIYINSIDDLRLHGILVRPEGESHRYVICIHGINSDGEFMSYYARHYNEMGLNVLLPDNRGFGKSDGHYTGYGYYDRLDILEWIYLIIRRDPEAKIMLHGTSMGAAITLMTTGERLPSQVVCAVSDSSYSTLVDEFADVYKKSPAGALPVHLPLLITRLLIRIRCGYDIRKVNVLEAVARSKTPTLFIHGDADEVIDPQMCARLYESCDAPKQYCMILGAGHVQGAYVDPDKYWKKTEGLMEKTGFIS